MIDTSREAAELAARGWPVLPLHHPMTSGCSCRQPGCGSVAKHPRIKGGLNSASNDLDQVTAWWTRWPRANVGVRTGAASGLVVVDIDPAHGGLDSLERLQRRYGSLPETLRVETGTRGAHLYFEHPGVDVRNDAGRRLGPGLDIRGDGGYIVAPPSVHAVGRRYQWLEPGAAPATLPDWLQQRLLHRESTRRPDPIVCDREYAQRALDRAAHAVATAPEGTRNNTLNRAAYRMGRLVDSRAVGRHAVEAALETAATLSGLSIAESRSTIASGLNASTKRSLSVSRNIDAERELALGIDR
jgi:hypothetical protein